MGPRLLLLVTLALCACTSPTPGTTTATVVGAPPLAPGFTIPRQAIQHRDFVIRQARYYWGLNADVGLFMGQIHQESRFDDGAQSAFASGIAQFTPTTAADMQKLYPELAALCPDVKGCPLDPKWAIHAMLLYDKRLYGLFGFASGDDRMAWMLVSYNGGAGWAQRERAQADTQGLDADRWFSNVETVCLRSISACTENRDYPRKILFKWRPGYRSWLAR